MNNPQQPFEFPSPQQQLPPLQNPQQYGMQSQTGQPQYPPQQYQSMGGGMTSLTPAPQTTIPVPTGTGTYVQTPLQPLIPTQTYPTTFPSSSATNAQFPNSIQYTQPQSPYGQQSNMGYGNQSNMGYGQQGGSSYQNQQQQMNSMNNNSMGQPQMGGRGGGSMGPQMGGGMGGMGMPSSSYASIPSSYNRISYQYHSDYNASIPFIPPLGLPPHVQQKMFQASAIFRSFDTDCSGYLTMHEWRRAMHQLGYYMSDHDAKRLFHMVDMDGSGKISEREFCEYWISTH